TYSLEQNNYTSDNSFTNLEPGIYTLYLIDGNGCESFYPFEILKTESIIIDLGQDITIPYNSTVQLNADVQNGNPPYSIQWVSDAGSNFSCLDSCLNPIVSNITNSFVATIIVEDSDGCMGSSSIQVFLKNQYNLYVPEAFSPNNDQVNDRLDIYGDSELEILSFQIFNRSGTKIYESNSMIQNQVDTGWDGTMRNSPMEQGAYLWLIIARQPDGKEIRFRGQTLLLK
ncbi:MAG: T9SS type B sorting domain-containing protein, partial [Saprospiraceae bacterium]|nr:T9SS type B sorting domain-containing protein [Saprospiraceae bacterium]